VANIVGKTRQFCKILINPQTGGNTSGYLCYFQGMGKACTWHIAFLRPNHLSFIGKTTKRTTMQDTCAVVGKGTTPVTMASFSQLRSLGMFWLLPG